MNLTTQLAKQKANSSNGKGELFSTNYTNAATYQDVSSLTTTTQSVQNINIISISIIIIA
jgi:hypothetical protein